MHQSAVMNTDMNCTNDCAVAWKLGLLPSVSRDCRSITHGVTPTHWEALVVLVVLPLVRRVVYFARKSVLKRMVAGVSGHREEMDEVWSGWSTVSAPALVLLPVCLRGKWLTD